MSKYVDFSSPDKSRLYNKTSSVDNKNNLVNKTRNRPASAKLSVMMSNSRLKNIMKKENEKLDSKGN